MSESQSADKNQAAEIMVAVVPVDESGRDAVGIHRPRMCACSFRRNGHFDRWLGTCSCVHDLLAHAAREIAPHMKGSALTPRFENGMCRDSEGRIVVRGEEIDPRAFVQFQTQLHRHCVAAT